MRESTWGPLPMSDVVFGTQSNPWAAVKAAPHIVLLPALLLVALVAAGVAGVLLAAKAQHDAVW